LRAVLSLLVSLPVKIIVSLPDHGMEHDPK
jgi:hypothetical protein